MSFVEKIERRRHGYHIYIYSRGSIVRGFRIAVKRRPDKVFSVIRSTFNPCFPCPARLRSPKFPFCRCCPCRNAGVVNRFRNRNRLDWDEFRIELEYERELIFRREDERKIPGQRRIIWIWEREREREDGAGRKSYSLKSLDRQLAIVVG